MTNHTLLHIHMPVYNGERYLEEAIHSVHVDMDRSGIDHYQIIAFDDASSDESAGILNRLRQDDNRLTILTAEKNGGVGNAYRTLMQFSSDIENGQPRFVTRREQDDISIAGATGKLIADFEERKRTDLGLALLGGVIIKFSTIGELDTPTEQRLERTDNQALMRKGIQRGHIPAWNPSLLIDMRQIGQKIINNYPAPRFCDDILFQALVLHSGCSIGSSNIETVKWRRNAESITSVRRPENGTFYLHAMREIWDLFDGTQTKADMAYVFARYLEYKFIAPDSPADRMIKRTLRRSFRRSEEQAASQIEQKTPQLAEI